MYHLGGHKFGQAGKLAGAEINLKQDKSASPIDDLHLKNFFDSAENRFCSCPYRILGTSVTGMSLEPCLLFPVATLFSHT